MKYNSAVLSIASSGILYGLVTVGGSLLSRYGFSVLDISFFFMFYSIIFLAPFAIKKDPKIFSKIRSAWKYLLAYGIVNLVILLMQFESLALGLSPPTVALLLYTQPVWTIIFGRMIFNEKITPTRLGIIALALFGVLLVTNPFSLHSQIGSNYSIGSVSSRNVISAEVLALGGGVFLALWVILGKKGRADQLREPISLTFAVRTFSIIPIGIVSVLAYVLRTGLFLSSRENFSFGVVYLVLFAIFAGAIPDFLFYLGVERLMAIQAGVILLIEPISAAILSALFKISYLSWVQVAGGALILLSNYFVLLESRSGASALRGAQK